MGLDQWVYFYPGRQPRSKTNFKIKNEERVEELFYWRKHYKLDEYMFNEYEGWGGKKEFNCQKVWLGIDSINNLKEEILNNKLFDDDLELEENERQKEEDLKFCELAFEKIEQKFVIYYTNWW
jgi:hypothetical protein